MYRTFEELFKALKKREADKNAPIAYSQSQNIDPTKIGEACAFSPLIADSQWADPDDGSQRTDVDWASDALGLRPSASNIWIGSSECVMSLRKRLCENLFTVFRGKKEFLLYPPWESYFIEAEDPEEKEEYNVYRWKWNGQEAKQPFVLEPTDFPPTQYIPTDPNLWAGHPRNARSVCGRFFRIVKPIHVTVKAGETLYLPTGWYHSVSKGADDGTKGGENDPMCICVNWWYNCDITDRELWAQHAVRLGTFSNEELDDWNHY